MKQVFLMMVCVIFTMHIVAQESDSISEQRQGLDYEVIEDQGENVEIVTDEIVKDAKKDTTSFVIGEKEISIVEDNGETSVKIRNLDGEEVDSIDIDATIEEDYSYSDDEDKTTDDSKKFKGHWSGFEFGPNNFLSADNSLTRDATSDFMDLNSGKSFNYNFNFAQYSFPVISDRVGLVSGMGFEWSNYHFSNNNSIQKLDGTIQARNLDVNPIKNRLQTTYLTVPLIAEVQIFKGDRNDRLYVGGGLIGGLKLFSNTKITYNSDGTKEKKKYKNDYYLRPFRYGVTGRIGYKMVKLYVNYYLTSLFLDEKGPELYPVAAGLAITF